MDPIHWFLDDKEDIRSSYYLEDVATEFQVQGLAFSWATLNGIIPFDIKKNVAVGTEGQHRG